MTVAELNDSYALPGVLAFDTHGELARARITLPHCSATVYLQGAHLAEFTPAGQPPVLYVSESSPFTPGKPIRGGVPLSFPWFAADTQARAAGKPGPAHGFARIEPWTLAFAALEPGDHPTLRLTFTLAPSDRSRSLGYDHFRLAMEFLFGGPGQAAPGRSVLMRLSILNLGQQALRLEEAMHTYFAVSDIHQVRIAGLENAPYFDKTDAGRTKHTPDGPLILTSETDRMFPGHTATISLEDPGFGRTIAVHKHNSSTTVVWNPWDQVAAKMADVAPGSWPRFVCVEAVNAGADAILLEPNASHTMECRIVVEPTETVL